MINYCFVSGHGRLGTSKSDAIDFNPQAHKSILIRKRINYSTRGIEDESHRVRRHFSTTRDYGA